MLVPRSLKATLFQHLHAGLTAGHMGVKKTQDRVKKMAYWRNGLLTWRCSADGVSSATVTDGAQAHVKVSSKKPLLLLEEEQATAGGPFTKIHVDLTGPHVR